MPFALLALEEGSLFEGRAIGYLEGAHFTVGEVVFNTAMLGYQEILSDPSYAGQLIAFTYPHIGNVGANAEDAERTLCHAQGIIVKTLTRFPSNWRQEMSLEDYLRAQKKLGIVGVDTRRLTQLIREKGALRGCLYHTPEVTSSVREEALALARQCPLLNETDWVAEVSTRTIEPFCQEGDWHVVAYDFGIKKSLLTCLRASGARITVVPAHTSAEVVKALSPDGIFLSNGPGDPERCPQALLAIRQFLEWEIPLFGVCLGHQLLALALEAKTRKMAFGHHGANHPVQVLSTGQVWITSQNHGFTVADEGLPDTLEVTHRSLFDGTIQGVRHKTKPVFGFQGHPEGNPGPQDARSLFAVFVSMMHAYRQKRSREKEGSCLKEQISAAF